MKISLFLFAVLSATGLAAVQQADDNSKTVVESNTGLEGEAPQLATEHISPYRFPPAYSYSLTTTTYAAEQKTKSASKVLITPKAMRTESETNGVKSISIIDIKRREAHHFMKQAGQKMHFVSEYKQPTEEEERKAAVLSSWKKLGEENEMVKWEETNKAYTAIHWLRHDGVPVKAELTYKKEFGGARIINKWSEFKTLDDKAIDPEQFCHPTGYRRMPSR